MNQITLTPGQAQTLTVPMTPDMLNWRGPAISEWEGPVTILGEGRPGYVAVGHFHDEEAGVAGVPIGDLRLPLNRSEVRDLLIRLSPNLADFRDGPALSALGWTTEELSAALLYLSWNRRPVRAVVHLHPVSSGWETRRVVPGLLDAWMSKPYANLGGAALREAKQRRPKAPWHWMVEDVRGSASTEKEAKAAWLVELLNQGVIVVDLNSITAGVP